MPQTQSIPTATASAGSIPMIDYDSHPAYGGMFAADLARAAEAIARIEPVAEASLQAQGERLQRLRQRGDPGCDVSRKADSDGVARLDTPRAEFEAFAAAAEPTVEQVRGLIDAARAKGKPVTREVAQHWLSREIHAPIFAAAQSLLTAAGALDIVRRYFGAEFAKLRNLELVVNRPGQSWLEQLFKDAGIETPATTGFHIDTDPQCVLKTAIYLSDVGDEQGPFGCVPKSHLWDQEGPNRSRRRAAHKLRLSLLDPESRHTFASLPRPYQLKASFGRDVPAGSPDERALLASELRTTGPRGQMTLFDPDMMHRGGRVSAGERVAIIATMGAGWRKPD